MKNGRASIVLFKHKSRIFFLQLDRARGIKLGRITKANTEAILESAELARLNIPDLHLMLTQTNTIENDHVTMTIHLYFIIGT